MRAALMRGIVVRAGPELVVLRGRAVLVCRFTAAADYRSVVQLVPFGPGQAGHHQFVGMTDQVKQFILGYRAVECDRVPVPLAEVVPRGDRGISAAQPGREIRVAFEADPAGAGPSVTSANILPATLNTATSSPNGLASADPGLALHAAITPSRSEPVVTWSPARPARSGLLPARGREDSGPAATAASSQGSPGPARCSYSVIFHRADNC
jgi:hypothetical protein